MNLKLEYNQDLIIDGHRCVLNMVENIYTPKNHIIRRHFVSSDLKFRTFRDQVLPLPVTQEAPPIVIAPAAAEVRKPGKPAPKPSVVPESPITEMAPGRDEDTDPAVSPEADEKKGLLGRVFGAKKGKKARK